MYFSLSLLLLLLLASYPKGGSSIFILKLDKKGGAVLIYVPSWVRLCFFFFFSCFTKRQEEKD